MAPSRSPYGERGLKFSKMGVRSENSLSLPVWGAWIEIHPEREVSASTSWSLPVWGAWIEIKTL